MIMETLIFIAVIAFVGWKVMLWWAQRRIEQEIVQEELLEELQRRIPVGLNIEEINGMVYGWDCKTMDFVCQGRDLTEFRSHFQARFPDRRGAIMAGSDELIERFKSEMETVLQSDMHKGQ